MSDATFPIEDDEFYASNSDEDGNLIDPIYEPVSKDREETIQLYERNTNLDITLTSPIGPFQLYSMRWEGDYNNRYYQRV